MKWDDRAWRMCGSKDQYNLKQVRRLVKTRAALQLRYYKCPYCGKYHLTKT